MTTLLSASLSPLLWILLRRFFSSLVHKIDDTNLLRIPFTMVKTREKATNDIQQCIQPKPRFLVVVANEEHNCDVPSQFDYGFASRTFALCVRSESLFVS